MLRRVIGRLCVLILIWSSVVAMMFFAYNPGMVLLTIVVGFWAVITTYMIL